MLDETPTGDDLSDTLTIPERTGYYILERTFAPPDHVLPALVDSARYSKRPTQTPVGVSPMNGIDTFRKRSRKPPFTYRLPEISAQ